MKSNSQLLFLLAAIFLVGSVVWFVRQNHIVAIGCLVVAIVELIIGLIFWRKTKGYK